MSSSWALNYTITLKPLFAEAQPPFAALPGSLTPGHSAEAACKYRINSLGDARRAGAALHSRCALEKTPRGLAGPNTRRCARSACTSAARGVALQSCSPGAMLSPGAVPRHCPPALPLPVPPLTLPPGVATRDGILEPKAVRGAPPLQPAAACCPPSPAERPPLLTSTSTTSTDPREASDPALPRGLCGTACFLALADGWQPTWCHAHRRVCDVIYEGVYCCSFSAVHQQMVAAPLLSRRARSCWQEEMTSALKLFLPDEKPISLHLTSSVSRGGSESKASTSQDSIFPVQGSREGCRQLMGCGSTH